MWLLSQNVHSERKKKNAQKMIFHEVCSSFMGPWYANWRIELPCAKIKLIAPAPLKSDSHRVQRRKKKIEIL